MTDDEKLTALFRDAAGGDAPPPGFGYGEVTAASRRITIRRRAALVGGAVALVAVAGIGSAVALPRGSEGTASSAAAPVRAPQAEGAPEAERQTAGTAAAPLGPGTTGCANRQDPALRALVDQALPALAGATEAATTDVCLPGTQRGVNLEVTDGGSTGLLTVTYLPPGTQASLVRGAISAPTASGGTVIISSEAVGSERPAPFAGRLPSVLAFLAARL
jgi:hypothetical protein